MRKIIILLVLTLLLLAGCKAPVDAINTFVLMDANKSVTAHFKKIEYTLSTKVDPIDGGTISGAGTYDEGTTVEVETIPVSGYVFDRWSFGDVKWSGLGMGLYDIDVISDFDDYVGTLLANGFTQFKIFPPKYYGSSEIAEAKVAVLKAVAKKVEVIWGYCAGPRTITADNWPDYRQGILDAAQWSQDNGVYEFRLGNEDLAHNDDTTLTDAQLITNIKSVATEVQAIFTNGNVSYACRSDFIDDWITAGKGDIDILASNVYMGGNGNYDENWKNLITDLVNAFGVDGTYLTEFAPSWSSLDDYSTDESVQATAVTEMIEYIKASGMTRALYFCYTDPYWLPGFGVMKDDGTYRLLWNQALLNSGSVKSITVPAKTATISLPDTIALIP